MTDEELQELFIRRELNPTKPKQVLITIEQDGSVRTDPLHPDEWFNPKEYFQFGGHPSGRSKRAAEFMQETLNRIYEDLDKYTVWGVDPAKHNSERTTISWRQVKKRRR